jgi:hypothetical protein
MSAAADNMLMSSDDGAYSLGHVKPRKFVSSALIYALPEVGDHSILRRFSICPCLKHCCLTYGETLLQEEICFRSGHRPNLLRFIHSH